MLLDAVSPASFLQGVFEEVYDRLHGVQVFSLWGVGRRYRLFACKGHCWEAQCSVFPVHVSMDARSVPNPLKRPCTAGDSHNDHMLRKT